MRSMTGYGTAVADTAAGRFTVEVRSVNHRFSEVAVRTPRDLAVLEDRLRAAVQRVVQRGRVELTVAREPAGRRPRTVRADLDLAAGYVSAARELAAAMGLAGEVTLAMVAAFPDVIRVEEAREDAEALWTALQPAVEAALAGLVAMRTAEGERLRADALRRLERLEALVAVVAGRADRVVEEWRARLRQRLREALGEVPLDEGRLAAEVALLAERADISEELVRLRSHLGQARELVSAGAGAVGRRLEFLLQEMGRETNTIGSKAGDLEIARAVIEMKSELESLREQVQNVE